MVAKKRASASSSLQCSQTLMPGGNSSSLGHIMSNDAHVTYTVLHVVLVRKCHA
jgi:hypothetical protein